MCKTFREPLDQAAFLPLRRVAGEGRGDTPSPIMSKCVPWPGKLDQNKYLTVFFQDSFPHQSKIRVGNDSLRLMKTNTPSPFAFHLPACIPRRRLASLLIGAAGLTVVAALWAQSQRNSGDLDEATLRAFSDLAILQPAEMNELLQKTRTPEEAAAGERARLAIQDPDAWAALFSPRDAAQQAAHAQAVQEFTRPFESTAVLENNKDAAYRAAEAEALRAIRSPVQAAKE